MEFISNKCKHARHYVFLSYILRYACFHYYLNYNDVQSNDIKRNRLAKLCFRGGNQPSFIRDSRLYPMQHFLYTHYNLSDRWEIYTITMTSYLHNLSSKRIKNTYTWAGLSIFWVQLCNKKTIYLGSWFSWEAGLMIRTSLWIKLFK